MNVIGMGLLILVGVLAVIGLLAAIVKMLRAGGR